MLSASGMGESQLSFKSAVTEIGGKATAVKVTDATATGALNKQHPPHTHHREERGGGCRYREAHHQTGTGRGSKPKRNTPDATAAGRCRGWNQGAHSPSKSPDPAVR